MGNDSWRASSALMPCVVTMNRTTNFVLHMQHKVGAGKGRFMDSPSSWTAGIGTLNLVSNDECQMTKETRSPNDEAVHWFAMAGFVIRISVLLRISSFVIRIWDIIRQLPPSLLQPTACSDSVRRWNRRPSQSFSLCFPGVWRLQGRPRHWPRRKSRREYLPPWLTDGPW